jgi:hypothetical protein
MHWIGVPHPICTLWKKEKSPALLGIRHHFFGHAAHSLVRMPTILAWHQVMCQTIFNEHLYMHNKITHWFLDFWIPWTYLHTPTYRANWPFKQLNRHQNGYITPPGSKQTITQVQNTTKKSLHDLRFPQWLCWRFSFSGMLLHRLVNSYCFEGSQCLCPECQSAWGSFTL